MNTKYAVCAVTFVALVLLNACTTVVKEPAPTATTTTHVDGSSTTTVAR